ncbi:MAG: hypothetical protein AVDCRST_MAG77-2810 [uncultured Chloroflexi bacterium]|uniref:Uncharacterized protein n=1 Tax=uncultured Chloroflexota bacterium TaxID=166587 RepID=A0A6J4J1U6_9CHLR|nr:MAG: hypothetical protein AVDCRST_MAG77-2810 [uncultured Chloroflexota bacterium]
MIWTDCVTVENARCLTNSLSVRGNAASEVVWPLLHFGALFTGTELLLWHG